MPQPISNNRCKCCEPPLTQEGQIDTNQPHALIYTEAFRVYPSTTRTPREIFIISDPEIQVTTSHNATPVPIYRKRLIEVRDQGPFATPRPSWRVSLVIGEYANSQTLALNSLLNMLVMMDERKPRGWEDADEKTVDVNDVTAYRMGVCSACGLRRPRN